MKSPLVGTFEEYEGHKLYAEMFDLEATTPLRPGNIAGPIPITPFDPSFLAAYKYIFVTPLRTLSRS